MVDLMRRFAVDVAYVAHPYRDHRARRTIHVGAAPNKLRRRRRERQQQKPGRPFSSRRRPPVPAVTAATDDFCGGGGAGGVADSSTVDYLPAVPRPLSLTSLANTNNVNGQQLERSSKRSEQQSKEDRGGLTDKPHAPYRTGLDTTRGGRAGLWALCYSI